MPFLKRSSTDKLNYTEKMFANWIENNIERISDISITKLATEIGVSASFITKTLKKIGYYGWKDLKIQIAKKDTKNDFVWETDYSQYIESTLIPSLRTSLSHVDQLDISSVAKIVASTEHVVWLAGEGFSYSIAKMESKKLAKIGIKAFPLNTRENQGEMVVKGDLVIFISASAETKSVVQVNKKLREKFKNLVIVMITLNLRADKKDYTYLITGNYNDYYNTNERETPRHSVYILMMLLDWIFIKAYEKKEGINKDDLLRFD